MAHIEKRGKQRYRIQLFLGRKDGKQVRKCVNFHGTLKDAQTRARELEGDRESGLFKVRGVIKTLDDFLDQWLTVRAGRVAERTLNDYTWLLKHYVRPHLGKRNLAEIEPLDVQAVYAKMSNLSARTIKYTHSVLRSAFSQAVNWRMIKWNPTDGVEVPKAKKKLDIRPFTQEQANVLWEACKREPYGIVFRVAITSGLRPEEYLALTWENVDLEAGTIRVVQALLWKRSGTGPHIGVTKTVKGKRTVPVPPATVEALKRLWRDQQKERMAGKKPWKQMDLIFTNSDGGPIDVGNLGTRHFKPLLERAGLPTTHRLYDCRHTWVTLLLAGGVNPKTVSEWAGHSSVAFTLDQYGHLIPSMETEATERINAMFERILKTPTATVPQKSPSRKKPPP